MPSSASAAAEDREIGGVEFRDQEQRILDEIRRLSPGQREVMAWTLAGYRPVEIADVLNKSPQTVRGNLHQARQNLKRAFGYQGGEDHA